MIARMINRRLTLQVQDYLSQFPAVALLGPRQVGKTTLARGYLSTGTKGPATEYLDLESARDR